MSNLSQLDPVYIPTSHFLNIHLNINIPSVPVSPQWSLSLKFPHQNPVHTLSSRLRTTCPAHFFLLDFITRKIFGEHYRSLSSLLCSILHSPVTSFPLGPNILLSTLFSNTLSLGSSLEVSGHISPTYLQISSLKLILKLLRRVSLLMHHLQTVYSCVS